MSKFNIGDKVTVVNTGRSYTTYNSWAEARGLSKYTDFKMSNKGDIGIIVAVGKHLCGDENLVAVEIDNVQYIFGETGVENYVEDTRTPAQKLGFIVGKRYNVSENSSSSAGGKVVYLTCDDGTDCPYFGDEIGISNYSANLKHVSEYIEPKLTPAQKAGLVIGQKYLVSRYSNSVSAGEAVTFIFDDGSSCPDLKRGDYTYNPYISDVSPYVEPPANTVIEFDKVLTKAQIDAIKTLVA